MRYLLFCLCYCILSSAGAQIHQSHQRFIEVVGGFIDKASFHGRVNSGCWLRASLGKYGKKEGVYQIGMMAQGKYYQPAAELIGVNQYFLEGSFAPKAFATTNRLFYLSPVIGVLIGYDGIQSGAVYASDSATVNVNRGIVGFTGGLSGEWNISSKAALILLSHTGRKPSPLGEDFSKFVGCKTTEKLPIVCMIVNTTLYGLQSIEKRF